MSVSVPPPLSINLRHFNEYGMTKWVVQDVFGFFKLQVFLKSPIGHYVYAGGGGTLLNVYICQRN